jgi:hypothetical protein
MAKSKLEQKRQRFHQKKTIKVPKTALYGAVALVVIALGFVIVGGGQTTASVPEGSYKFQPVNYQGLRVDAITVQSLSNDDGVSISLSDLEQSKVVEFEYKGTPLMAYITSQGDTIVAIRMCEPCNGKSFSIVNGVLHCNACGTEWDLETNVGIRGGCKLYPPDRLEYSVQNGRIYVDAEDVLNWRPRV